MSIQIPYPVQLHVWKSIVAIVTFVGYPLTALSIALLWKNSPVLSVEVIALALAALSTTWHIWAETKQVGEKLARAPERRSEVFEDLGTGFYAWGIVCLASWLGFFSQVVA